jgi:hypothetical protein
MIASKTKKFIRRLKIYENKLNIILHDIPHCGILVNDNEKIHSTEFLNNSRRFYR